MPGVLPVDDRPASGRARLAVPLLTTAALAAVAAVAGRHLLGGLPVASQAWAPAPGSTSALWDAARSDWVAAGTGALGPGDSLWWVLAVLGAPFGSPSAVVTVLLVGAPLLAGASAWWAAGALTRVPWWRAAAALTWVATPALLVGISEARVGAVLAHVALPFAVRAVAHSATTRFRRVAWSWSGAASLALVLVTAGAPALLLPLALTLVLVSVLAYRAAPAVASLPSLVLAAPLLVEALRRPALLVADPGVPSPGTDGPWVLRGWEPLLGWPGTSGGQTGVVERVGEALSSSGDTASGVLSALGPLVWVAAGAPLVLAVVALPRSVSGGARGTAVRSGLGLTAVGLVSALVASRVEVGLSTDGAVTAWAGAATGLVVLGLVVAGVGGTAGASLPRPVLPEGAPTWRRRGQAVLTSGAARHAVRGVAVLCAAVVVLLPAAGLAAWTLSRVPDPAPGQAAPVSEPSLPAVIADAAASRDQVRTLALAPVASGDQSGPGSLASGIPDVRAELLRGDGPRLDRVPAALSLREASTGPGPAREALDRAVGGLLSVDARAPRVLGPFGVGFVVLVTPPEGSDPALVQASERVAARLDATSGLTSSGAAGRVLAWRVEGLTGQGATAPDRPGAVRVVTDAGWQVLPSTERGVDTQLAAGEPDVARTVVLSEASDGDWVATLDGVPLDPVTVGDWAQGFLVPPQGGHLVVEHRTVNGATWHWVLLVVVVVAVLVALPVRRGAPVRRLR